MLTDFLSTLDKFFTFFLLLTWAGERDFDCFQHSS